MHNDGRRTLPPEDSQGVSRNPKGRGEGIEPPAEYDKGISGSGIGDSRSDLEETDGSPGILGGTKSVAR